jgi:acetate kinase
LIDVAMKILVANLGSTSFKFRLFDMAHRGEPMLARGGVERIGSSEARVRIPLPGGDVDRVVSIPDHGAAMQICLDTLTGEGGVLESVEDVSAIGFKAVHSRDYHAVHPVDDALLASMEAYSTVAPAHNPPYVKAMRTLAERFPAIPQVATFETDFHTTIPDAHALYAIPEEWGTKLGVRRWGFHGASHRYIAGRVAELMGRPDLKLISCHLGGSSSLCAIRRGRSEACSLGMSPQSGLPHNNRVGDLDVFALPAIMRETGLALDQVLDALANKSGLEGLSGAGRDLRDIESAAEEGHPGARLAIDVFVASIRHYLGSYLLMLNGADAIVFTAGIGENSARIREAVLADLGWFGITLDPKKNATAKGECRISTNGSRVQVWTVPTNEEIVVARQTRELLTQKTS